MLDNIRKNFFEAEIKILGFFFMALKLKNCHYRKINEKTLENLQKIVERKKDYNKVNRKRFIISRNEAVYVGKEKFRRLKRIELYEIMLAQSKEIDRLRDELAKTNEKLENQEIKLANAGSIAEASLSLTKVFEESQKAADLYLKNVKQMNGEAEYEKG